MEDPYIAEIWIRSDITLTNSRPLPALRNLRHLTMVGRCNYGWDEDIARSAGGARDPDAAKCVIDADGKSGIFEVYGPARLDLWDLSLTNGDVDGFGGAVAVTYGRVELNRCELRGNNATRGGAVSNWHGRLTSAIPRSRTTPRFRRSRVPLGRVDQDGRLDDPGEKVPVQQGAGVGDVLGRRRGAWQTLPVSVAKVLF